MEKKKYGVLEDGREVSMYHLKKGKLSLDVIDFGAILVNIIYDGVDVALGYKDLDTYLVNDGNLGAVIAPNANRIANACFAIDGQVYELEKNDGENNLHSSILYGAHKKLWQAEEVLEDAITLSLSLKDGECGFPGNRLLKVTYRIEEDALKIRYAFISDKKTVFNPTNHSYFNLNGHNSGTARKHELKLNCSYYTPDRAGSIPTGVLEKTEGTPMDFKEFHAIGEHMDMSFAQLALTSGYDHNYAVDHYDGSLRYVGTLKGEKSGICMDTYSDLPGVQLYVSNFLDNENGKENTHYHVGDAVCLETQYFPNAVNQEGFVHPIVPADHEVHSETNYCFHR